MKNALYATGLLMFVVAAGVAVRSIYDGSPDAVDYAILGAVLSGWARTFK